ncbi:MAG: hypothetical protein PHO27_02325 [Sulfuricurvum sp.]|nr:hypothetical protein [Sulfuricurvum sp.]
MFQEFVDRYHSINWLAKGVDLERRIDRSQHSDLSIKASAEFIIIMADVALRISRNNYITRKLPTDQEYLQFISLYINSSNADGIQAKLIRDYGMLALTLITFEQIKFKFPLANILGRLLCLYEDYSNEIREMTGLEIREIVTILLAINAFYEEPKNFAFLAEYLEIQGYDALQPERISAFLEHFSINIKGYKEKLRDLGFDREQLYSFRLLERYPIIKNDDRSYIVPSVDALFYSAAQNMYNHLLEFLGKKDQKLSGAFQDQLGISFENYVRQLTNRIFKNVTEAKAIVPKGSLNAEFIINHGDTAVVIEAKKFVLKRDIAFKNSIDELDTLLERHIKKAYRQIEKTFKHVHQTKKMGLIVIFGELNANSSVVEYMREKHKDPDIAYLDNIAIISIGSFEVLMANDANEVIHALEEFLLASVDNRGDLFLRLDEMGMEMINPLLNKAFLEVIRIDD